jgi:SOS response regulatory protein OraA/RecX
VKRGIDREAALIVIAVAEVDQNARIEAAYQKIRRIQPQLSYPSVARKLERLGFPSSLIYAVLREHAADELGPLLGDQSSDA